MQNVVREIQTPNCTTGREKPIYEELKQMLCVKFKHHIVPLVLRKANL